MRLFDRGNVTLPFMLTVPAGNGNCPAKTIPNGNSYSRPKAYVSFIIGINPVLAGTFEMRYRLFDIINAPGSVED